MTTQQRFWKSTGGMCDDGETLPRFLPTPSSQEPGISPERLVDKNGNKPLHANQRLYDKHTGRLAQKGLSQAIAIYGETLIVSTSSVPDSHVRTSAMQEGEMESKENAVDCFLKPFAWFDCSDPDTCCWKTWQRSLLEDWIEYTGSWHRSVIVRNRIAYRLPPLVPRISGIGSSFLPTPTIPRPHDNESTAGKPVASQNQRDLATAVIVEGMLPTPRATDGSKGSRSVEGAKKELERGRNLDLGTVVRLLPTPVSRDWKSRKGKTQEERGRSVGPSLSEVSGGQLNPTWVEWLMGFPTGWTDLNA